MQGFTGELVQQEILALIASGAESTHTLQGVYLGFCKEQPAKFTTSAKNLLKELAYLNDRFGFISVYLGFCK